MSEYQYYEFQAIDRPLSTADREALRELSTRAQITTTRFVNTYEWGDFKGDPAELMDRWFDLHLYLANWGTRRLMIRLPECLVDQSILERFIREVDCATVTRSSGNLILDIVRDLEPDDDWDDGSGWLAELAPLRSDLLAGDLRVFYLLWLTAVEDDVLEADEEEPMPGIGPVTEVLEAFADFFRIDPDLVSVAAERSSCLTASVLSSPEDVRRIIASMADGHQTEMLARLFEGDQHVSAELRRIVCDQLASETSFSHAVARTAGELRSRATSIRLVREREEEAKRAAERQREAEEAKKAFRARLDTIARRGEGAWSEVETEINRRNAAGYDKATRLLHGLRTIAGERGTMPDFSLRLQTIRERHARKERFIKRLTELEQDNMP